MNIKTSGMDYQPTSIGLMSCTGPSALFVRTGITLDLMTKKLPMSGVLSIYMQVVLTDWRDRWRQSHR